MLKCLSMCNNIEKFLVSLKYKGLTLLLDVLGYIKMIID